MIAEGAFPFDGEDPEREVAPRVGDGMVRVDSTGRVSYASPNAVSAYRRLGVTSNVTRRSLTDFDLDDETLMTALQEGRPVESEVEARGSVVLRRLLPLTRGERVLGAVMLMREVTELRRHERLLLSKDATIREIHHRVKNNLQTVASLLRLRASAGDPQRALSESVDRILSIAEVHDLLTESREGDVDLADLLQRVAPLLGHGLGARPAEEDLAHVMAPGDVATAVAVIFSELYANALEHGGGDARVSLRRDGDLIEMRVDDDGPGLPPDFDPEHSLGLTIARSLASDQLGGSLDLEDGRPGVRARLRWPAE
jgi:two-component sensor histidine kinase